MSDEGQQNPASDACEDNVSQENTGETIPVDELNDRIQEAISTALAEQKDSVLRAHAEVQNIRRRAEQDVEKAHKFALERFSKELLTVVDNLERALDSVPTEQNDQVKAFCEGVELTHKGLVEVLGRFNVMPIDPVGTPFDPEQHQAVTTVPNSEVEANTVLEVMQKGYSLNDRVIRPAMVVVSKNP
jgi:molecular chaperone GrpE